MKTQWTVMMTVLLGAAGMAQAAFVTIGDAGNTADPSTGYGAVGYEYQISATEVTIAEFQASGAGDGDEDYWNDSEEGTSVGTAAPAVNVSLYEAMKYCNYLTSGSVNNGYYSDAGGGVWEANALSHDAYAAANGLTYFLPTEDEWYKAAYYTGNSSDYWSLYANGTDTVPTHGTTSGWNYYNSGYVNGSPNFTWTAGYGGEEQNGTYDMMGNVYERLEDSDQLLGGAYYDLSSMLSSSENSASLSPAAESQLGGFRVVAVPEPATMGLLALGGLLTWLVRLKQRL